jgi:pimeloyl-ACP methyl ester carboxylesterase
MVCIHGMLDTWRTWQAVLPGLEARHEVLAITLPGHWGGPRIPDGAELTMRLFSDAVEAELDRAGFEAAHLVGSSLGGWLALELATRGRALSVVALSPAGGWYRGTAAERRVERFFRRSYTRGRRAAPYAGILARLPMAREVSLRHVVSRPSNVSRAVLADMIRGIAACSVVMPAMQILGSEGFEDQLAPIDCPVRIAWGTQDRIVPLKSASARFRTLVPGAEFVELPGLGHIPMTDDPDLVVATILELSERIDQAFAGATPVPMG